MLWDRGYATASGVPHHMKRHFIVLVLLVAALYGALQLEWFRDAARSALNKMAAGITKSTPPPANNVNRHNIICPQCRGEGAVMVRRFTTGSVTDVKTMCALCMGRGKREFEIPPNYEICGDCGGMGKRLVRGIGSGTRSTSLRRRPLSLEEERDQFDGFAERAPTSTSCPRCLGRGAIYRPGQR